MQPVDRSRHKLPSALEEGSHVQGLVAFRLQAAGKACHLAEVDLAYEVVADVDVAVVVVAQPAAPLAWEA